MLQDICQFNLVKSHTVLGLFLVHLYSVQKCHYAHSQKPTSPSVTTMVTSKQFARLLTLLLFALLFTGCRQSTASFVGVSAWDFLEYQVALGPRPVGSEAHDRTVGWIFDTLNEFEWTTEIQESSKLGHPIQNIIGRRGEGKPWIILGAHYDTRLISDQDSDRSKRNGPVLGANDGASGVAVLLELARVLPKDLDLQIWLVFFDAEDNGDIPGWDWILGSSAFVEQLSGTPNAVVILDMIGDTDLNIFFERNSNDELNEEIWAQAGALGYAEYFIPTPKFSMLDDHTPFLRAGIPAVDIIDFDYPYWHTSLDTLENVSQRSLQIVGDTILSWLLDKAKK